VKNTSLIINVVLGIAIVVLYILHFTQSPTQATDTKTNSKPSVKKEKADSKEDTSKEVLSVAYINVDSLDARYEFSINARKTMQTKERILQSDLEKRAMSLQNEVVTFQKTMNSMTMEQAKGREQELMQKQQDLEQYRQSAGSGYVKEEQELQKKLLGNINDFMTQYAEANGYDYILPYSGAGSGTLYANPAFDITDEVIKGLNEEYKSEKKKP
jgi:outer membrane protein